MSAKILIVEDRPEIQTLIRMTLEFEGHDLHTADNGGDGWRLAQSLRPDLVLLDIMMPGELDGLQVCERIRARPELDATRVVLLTARCPVLFLEPIFAPEGNKAVIMNDTTTAATRSR